MQKYVVGTTMIILSAIFIVVVALTDVPKMWVIGAVPVILIGFGIQMQAMWQMRPSVMIPNATPLDTKPASKFYAPRAIGIILALAGSLGAVAVGIYVTQNAGYLWALLLVALIVQKVSTTKTEYTWKPTFLGLVMGLLCVGIAVVIWFVKDADYLWALILVGFLTDSVI